MLVAPDSSNRDYDVAVFTLYEYSLHQAFGDAPSPANFWSALPAHRTIGLESLWGRYPPGVIPLLHLLVGLASKD